MSVVPFFYRDAQDGKLKLGDEARQFLMQLDSDILFVSVSGGARGGKSTLLNLLAKERSAFQVSGTTKSCTKWSWMLCKVLEFHGKRVVLFDSEGVGDTDSNSSHDALVFGLTCMFSSVFIMNMMRNFDTQQIAQLQAVTMFVESVMRLVTAEEKSSSSMISDSEEVFHLDERAQQVMERVSPYLVFLVRDKSLENQENESDEAFMERKLANQVISSSTAEKERQVIEDTNAIRTKIRTCFPRRTLLGMDPPVNDHQHLKGGRSVSALSENLLNRVFVSQLNQLKQLVAKHGRPMVEPTSVLTSQPVVLNGPMYVAYVQSCLDACNSNAFPNLRSPSQALAELMLQEKCRVSVQECKQNMAKLSGRPLSVLKKQFQMYRNGYSKRLESSLLTGSSTAQAIKQAMLQEMDQWFAEIETQMLRSMHTDSVSWIETALNDWILHRNSQPFVDKLFVPLWASSSSSSSSSDPKQSSSSSSESRTASPSESRRGESSSSSSSSDVAAPVLPSGAVPAWWPSLASEPPTSREQLYRMLLESLSVVFLNAEETDTLLVPEHQLWSLSLEERTRLREKFAETLGCERSGVLSAETKQQLEELTNQVHIFQAQCEQLQHELVSRDQKVHELSLARDEFQAEAQQWKRQWEDAQERLGGDGSRIAQLEEEQLENQQRYWQSLEQFRKYIAELEMSKHQLEQESVLKSQEIEHLKEHVRTLSLFSEQMQPLREDMSLVTSQIQNLRKNMLERIDTANVAKQKAEQDLSELKIRLSSLQSQNSALSIQVDRMSNAYNQITESLTSNQQELKRCNQEMETQRKDSRSFQDSMVAKINALVTPIDGLQRYIQSRESIVIGPVLSRFSAAAPVLGPSASSVSSASSASSSSSSSLIRG